MSATITGTDWGVAVITPMEQYRPPGAGHSGITATKSFARKQPRAPLVYCPARRSGHATANQFGRQRRQSIVLTFRPTILDRHVLTFDVASVSEAFAEGGRFLRGANG
jgi:hypothetical protein